MAIPSHLQCFSPPHEEQYKEIGVSKAQRNLYTLGILTLLYIGFFFQRDSLCGKQSFLSSLYFNIVLLMHSLSSLKLSRISFLAQRLADAPVASLPERSSSCISPLWLRSRVPFVLENVTPYSIGARIGAPQRRIRPLYSQSPGTDSDHHLLHLPHQPHSPHSPPQIRPHPWHRAVTSSAKTPSGGALVGVTCR